MIDEPDKHLDEPVRFLGAPVQRVGWRTSEFWLSAATTLVGLLVASGVIETGAGAELERIIGLVAAVAASLGYAISRSIVKS